MIPQIIFVLSSTPHPLRTAEDDLQGAKMLCDYINIHSVIRVIEHLLYTVDNYKTVYNVS